MQIRPMRPEDAPHAAALGRAVFQPPGTPPPSPAEERFQVRRHHHLMQTDPGGCWVATDDDGAVQGAAVSLLRDGVWGLSFLAVDPDRQGRGIGRQLLDHALAYGARARGRIILSSTDPKAMRRYARAGLDLHPCVAAAGIVDRSRLPAEAPGIVASDDVEATAPISRHVRGATHHLDIPQYLDYGMRLLLHGDRGFVVFDDQVVKLLAARDEQAAVELLWAALARAPRGGTVGVDFLTARQQWAIRTVLEAGLALSPDGPIYTSGDVGPMAPYIPSGAYL
jgi:GNAT superfamily N-acetyltransferase